MTVLTRTVSEMAAQMALLPVLTLGGLALRGYRRDVGWWWLALAFGISWLADMAALWIDPAVISEVYPVMQAAIVGAVLLTRRDAFKFLALLVAVGLAAVMIDAARGQDVFLRSVAWLGVCGIVADRWALDRLRVALLVSFGLGWVTWTCYAAFPGWPSWGVYQVTRLAGLLLFCWAVVRPAPSLKLEPA